MPLKKAAGPVVGLDIGSSFIKVCELECKGGKASLRGIALLPTPPEVMSNNEIVDPVTLGKTIKHIMLQAGIKAKKVVTCVTGQSSLVVRIIEVPKMTRAELQETMKWEIERHVPFAAEQVVMDYQPLVPPEEVPDGQNMEVLLAVAQEALVTRHVEAVQAAGLHPLAIDIEPLAMSRSLLDLSNGAGPAGTVACVDVGASTTDISIYRDGRIAFTRSIQLAGNNLTKAISDVLGRPLAEAEQLKTEMAKVGDAGAAPSAQDLFGSDFGEISTLDFGGPAPEALGGGVLGGTFGAGAQPDPGASTATDTQSEPAFDIAGGGFSSDAFTTPAEPSSPPALDPAPAPAAPEPEAPAPFDLTGAAPDPATLGGPVPMANPFDPDAAPPDPATANPFDSPGLGGASPFGPVPGADPFGAALEPRAGFGAVGTPASAPAAMSDEEYTRTQISDAIMPVLHELVTELRRSLDFYRNRANGLGAQQVIITGGTARLPGLTDFLAANLEVPVSLGNPLEYVLAGPKSDPGYLLEVGPVFPVSIGLAVRELLMDTAPVRKKK